MEKRFNPIIEEALYDITEGLKRLYGDKLKSVILYGSYARGEELEDSDIDIMVLVDEDTLSLRNYWEGLSDISVDADLKYLKVFSLVDTCYSDFLRWKDSLPFYVNVRKEGMELYAAG